MANTVITLNGHLTDFPATQSADKAMHFAELANFFRGLAGGSAGYATVDQISTAVAATGTLTLSSASGTVGGTINGTLVTVTASGGDTTTAAAIAVAINANSSVNKIVVATSALGVVTLTAYVPGVIGNCCTLVASGTGVTASAAKLAGGTNDTKVTYTA